MSSFKRFMLVALIVPILFIITLVLSLFGLELAAKIALALGALFICVLLILGYIAIIEDLF